MGSVTCISQFSENINYFIDVVNSRVKKVLSIAAQVLQDIKRLFSCAGNSSEITASENTPGCRSFKQQNRAPGDPLPMPHPSTPSNSGVSSPRVLPTIPINESLPRGVTPTLRVSLNPTEPDPSAQVKGKPTVESIDENSSESEILDYLRNLSGELDRTDRALLNNLKRRVPPLSSETICVIDSFLNAIQIPSSRFL